MGEGIIVARLCLAYVCYLKSSSVCGREGERCIAVSCKHLSQHPEYGLIPEKTGAFTGCSPIGQPSVAASIVHAQWFSQTQSSGDPGYKT